MHGIYAVVDASYLPERFAALHHSLHGLQMAVAAKDTGAVDLETYYVSLERVGIAFFFGRIAFLLLMAFLFWNCGPRIARFLLPARRNSPQSS